MHSLTLPLPFPLPLPPSPSLRLEEDDERMKAIQAGKSVVEKIYNDLESNISAEEGSLDIGKLADPHAVSGDSEPTPPAPQKVQLQWNLSIVCL